MIESDPKRARPARQGAGKLSPPLPSEQHSPVSVRRSLFDPLVIAAIVGLLGGGVTLAITSEVAQVRHLAELVAQREKAICDRAFAFLQDEAIHPRLEKDDAFYRSQRRIAEGCSIERKTP